MKLFQAFSTTYPIILWVWGIFFLSFANGQSTQPNILFLFTDDQQADALGIEQPHMLKTPHMDSIAKAGVRFTNAYIMGAYSGAVCAPSRAMLMSGRNLFSIDPKGNTIDADHTTLPQYLRSQGYRTFHTGKWHNGKAAFHRSFTDGEHIFFGGMSDHYEVPLHHFDESGEYANEDKFYLSGKHSSELYADAAVDFLDTYQGEDPFFMFVSFQAPHDPRQIPDEFVDMYPSDEIILPKNFLPEHPFDNGELDIRDEWLASNPRTKGEIRNHLAAYYAMISHVDDQIGKILKALNRSGKTEETIIIFAADNGLAVGQHGLMGKQNVYEHGVNVPLMFCGPGIPQNEERDAFIFLFDIYPTLCDLLTIPKPESVQGNSYVPVIHDSEKEMRESMLYAYKGFQRAFRKGDWKWLQYQVRGKLTEQLFHIEEDPWEKNNLIDTPRAKEVLPELTASMMALMEEVGDPVDLKLPDWGVEPTESWKDQNKGKESEGMSRLRKMAEEERKKFLNK